MIINVKEKNNNFIYNKGKPRAYTLLNVIYTFESCI